MEEPTFVTIGSQIIPIDRYQPADFRVIRPEVTVTIETLDLDSPIIRIDPPEARPDPTSSPGPFDIRANGMRRAQGEGVKVNVVLADRKAHFRNDRFVISAGSDTSAPHLRRDEFPANAGPRPRQFSFYIQRDDTQNLLSFNLGLVVMGNTAGRPWNLEIFIDPKIENGGG